MPLCWFSSRNHPWEDLLNRAFGYGVINFLLNSSDEGGALEPYASVAEIKSDPDGALERAQEVIGFERGSIPMMLRFYEDVFEHQRRFELAVGSSYPIRVNIALHYECRDGLGITEREFRIHCALLSLQGSRRYCRAGWEVIQHRAHGYLKKQQVPRNEIAGLYPRGQIERSLHKLIDRELWHCVSWPPDKHAGQRYWTNRGDMGLEGLVKAVNQLKSKSGKAQRDRIKAKQLFDELRS